MRTHPHARRRLVRGATALAIAGASALVVAPIASAAPDAGPPDYHLVSNVKIPRELRSDIAGSAFVDADGQFHWTTALTAYNPLAENAWARTFTNSDFGAVAAGVGTSTVKTTADALYTSPGSVCYNLDEHPEHPIATVNDDDHCDVIGVWVDPKTKTWHALLNDEFQFDPWETRGAAATPDQKIGTGHHNNRILLATSDDKGASWQYDGVALTSGWDAKDGIITPETSPGQTYPFGNSGCRLFVDYSSGYFYITYNVKIYKKPASSTVASWMEMARAPISEGMAPGSWTKYRNGEWTEPGIGGIDGNVGDVPGLNVNYDPQADLVSYTGEINGNPADYRAAIVQSDRILTFADADGTQYSANTLAHTITRVSDGVVVPQVDYTDPSTGLVMNVIGKDDRWENGKKVFTGGIFITQTDPATGVPREQHVMTGSGVYKDQATNRIYVPFPNIESAITYNAHSGLYRIFGYDRNVYEIADLSDPTSWKVVGVNPPGSGNGYLTSLDDGSRTNQNVTGSSYLSISDLTGDVHHTSMTTSESAATQPTRLSLHKADGSALDTAKPAVVSVGEQTLGNGKASHKGKAPKGPKWTLEPVANPDFADGSGFYRLKNAEDGTYLQVAGDSVEAKRALGATVISGPKQPDADPTGNSGFGTPGGSDQWYVQVVAPNTTGASDSTSLADSTTYRLVNRNSGWAVEAGADGTFRLAQQAPGQANQYLTFSTPGRS